MWMKKNKLFGIFLFLKKEKHVLWVKLGILQEIAMVDFFEKSEEFHLNPLICITGNFELNLC